MTTKDTVDPQKRDRTIDTSWHDAFISALAEVPSVRKAAKVAKVSFKTAYRHRALYPSFAERWDKCLDLALVMAEWQLIDKAVSGDTTAQIFLLKNQRTGSKNPPLYSPPSKNIRVGVDQPIPHEITIKGLESVEQLAAFLSKVMPTIAANEIESGGDDAAPTN